MADTTGNNRIQKFTACPPVPAQCCPQFAFQWGSIGTGNSQFENVYDLAVDGNGNVYVADTGNGRVEVSGTGGNSLTQWPVAGPDHGIAVNQSGTTVYVAENTEVQEFTSSGTLITSWGGPGSGNGQFNQLMGIAVDGFGNVYTVETGNERVQKFDFFRDLPDGLERGRAGGTFNNLNAIAVDANNHVFTTETINTNLVDEFDTNGVLINAWTTWPFRGAASPGGSRGSPRTRRRGIFTSPTASST